jgi:hypothetical protein
LTNLILVQKMSACLFCMAACIDSSSFFHDINIDFFFLQILTGHQDNAEFALAMCRTEPYVLSGGDYFFFKVISTISI